MKIYKFELFNEQIIVYEAEAEEKPKSYYIKSRNIWETRVLKDEINRLDRSSLKMFSLSPDRAFYIKELIKYFEERKERTAEALKRYNKKISFLRDVAEEIERGTEENESGGIK